METRGLKEPLEPYTI